MKKAILVASFGSVAPNARRAFDQIEARLIQRFPHAEVRWAYTSKRIRAKLAQLGVASDSPETALAKLMEDGYTHVAVLPLHTIPGIEFHELYRNAMLFGEMSGGCQRIRVARPLLSSQADMGRVITALLQHIPKERQAEDAVLFMGHGSKNHPSDALYAAVNFALQDLSPRVYVATLQGYPSLESVLPKLFGKSGKKVYLMPFMSIAGEHARKDMAGEQPGSWKSILNRSGFACEIVMKGTAEYPEMVEIWLDHLQDAFSQLDDPDHGDQPHKR